MTGIKSPSSSARGLWVAAVTGASTLISLALACATPFPALSALAGARRRMSDGILLVAAAWGVAQTIGFCARGFAMDAQGAIWSATLLAAAIISVMAAHRLSASLSSSRAALRIGASYVGAFVAFKAVVLVTSLMLDSGHNAFTAEVLARQFVRNGFILGALLVLQAGLGRVGLGIPPTRPAHA
jgi:hypothetical protein